MPGESTGDGARSALRGCRTSGRFRPCSPRSLQMEGGRPGRPSGSLEFSINSYRTALGGTEPQPLLTTSSIIVVMPLACPEAWRELAAVLTEGTHIPGANTRHPHGHLMRSERETGPRCCRLLPQRVTRPGTWLGRRTPRNGVPLARSKVLLRNWGQLNRHVLPTARDVADPAWTSPCLSFLSGARGQLSRT